MEERMVEDNAAITACKVEGCCPKKCSDKFSLDELLQFNIQCRDLDYYNEGSNVLDLVILGAIRAMCRTNDDIKTGSGIIKKDRKRQRMIYTLSGVHICEKLFLLVHAIKIKRFKRLMKHFKTNGLMPPMHGNVKRTPKNTCKKETVEQIVSFIRNYAEEAALFMPGRLASQYNIVKLLPSSDTKVGIYRKYKEICTANNETCVGRGFFLKMWRTFCSDVVVMKPKSDLCAICQKNYTSHSKLSGATEDEKADFFMQCQEHLQHVATERAAYRSTINETVKNFEKCKIQRREDGTPVPNSYDGGAHYSFDFAQQIHVPFDSLQPGPIYFLTPFKVGLYGIMNDTIKMQHNFIIPESCQVTKGSNAIVSYLHYYLENHGLGEKHLFLHADNCVGQNKNNIVVSYLNWRILNGLNDDIELSFLPVGHTKFACDWAFGLFKRKVRVEKASSLAEVASIITKSTPLSNVNQPVLTGNEKGEVFVPIYDWLNYFASKGWHAIKNITVFNHFILTSNDKGKVFTKNDCNGPSTEFIVSHETQPLNDFPSMVIPPGLSYERKLYLFQKIRPYCADESKDLLCPDPGPRPVTEQVSETNHGESEEKKTPKRRRNTRKPMTQIAQKKKDTGKKNKKFKNN